MSLFTYERLFSHMHVSFHMYASLISDTCLFLHTHIHVHICMCLCIFTRLFSHIHISIEKHMSLFIYYRFSHRRVYVHIHTSIFTYTHLFSHISVSFHIQHFFAHICGTSVDYPTPLSTSQISYRSHAYTRFIFPRVHISFRIYKSLFTYVR